MLLLLNEIEFDIAEKSLNSICLDRYSFTSNAAHCLGKLLGRITNLEKLEMHSGIDEELMSIVLRSLGNNVSLLAP